MHVNESGEPKPTAITDVCRIYGVQNHILLYSGKLLTFLFFFLELCIFFNCYATKRSARIIKGNTRTSGDAPQIVRKSAIQPMMVSTAQAKSPRVIKIFVIKSTQLCYTACAEATSFLRSSCGHPQVQTVPSSTWDAPCPVVTPSLKGLGSAFSVYLIIPYFDKKVKCSIGDPRFERIYAEAKLLRRIFCITILYLHKVYLLHRCSAIQQLYGQACPSKAS